MERKPLIDEVLADAEKVKELATKHAHTTLVEVLSDKVSRAVKEAIDKIDDEEEEISSEAKDDQEVLDLDELPEKEVEEAEGGEKKDIDFGGEEETPEEKEMKKKALQATAEEVRLGEGEDEWSEEEEEEEVDEAKDEEGKDFSDDEIEEVYDEIFQEVEHPSIDSKVNPEDHLEKAESKEKDFEDQEVPAKKDFVPKEAYLRSAIVRAGRKLLEQNRKIRKLQKIVREVNLLNAKLVSVSKLARLTENKTTKEKIIEIIDSGRSLAEVKRLEIGALKLIKNLRESKGVQRSPLSRSSSAALPVKGRQVIREDATIRRMKELAGIPDKDKKDE